jgi:hypothetical protein
MGEVSPGVCRPLAVGVLHVPPGLSEVERRRQRLDFALSANAQGYFLLETVEVDARQPHPGYAHAEDLAVRADADAFVVRGAVDLPRLTRIADHVRMTIRRLTSSDGCSPFRGVTELRPAPDAATPPQYARPSVSPAD